MRGGGWGEPEDVENTQTHTHKHKTQLIQIHNRLGGVAAFVPLFHYLVFYQLYSFA